MDINDIKHLAVERIFLVPDASEGQLGYVWCDDPAPGIGMDTSEAAEYVRKDVHEARIAQLEADCAAHKAAEETQIALRQKMEEERDKQAAYIDRLSRAIGACMSNDERKFVFSPDDYLELEHALDATFSESLARRDALNKAGAMDWVLAQSCNEENEGVMWRTKIVEPEIQRLRQQANQC